LIKVHVCRTVCAMRWNGGSVRLSSECWRWRHWLNV